MAQVASFTSAAELAAATQVAYDLKKHSPDPDNLRACKIAVNKLRTARQAGNNSVNVERLSLTDNDARYLKSKGYKLKRLYGIQRGWYEEMSLSKPSLFWFTFTKF